MRVPTPPPSTGSERGGKCTYQAHICESNSGASNDRVQRRTRATSSGTDDNLCESTGGAIEPAIRNNRAGRASREKCKVKSKNVSNGKNNQNNNGRKKTSRRMRKWINSCLPDPAQVNLADGRLDSVPPSGSQRRSARLAGRQKRTGHHRAECKQREAKKKAKQAMDRMREKLRAKDQDVLEDMEEEPGNRGRSRRAARSTREDNAKSAPIPFELRKAARNTVKMLTENWREDGHGKLTLPKPDGVGRLTLENINSLCIKNGLGPRQPRPATMDRMRKEFDAPTSCAL